MVVLRVFRGIAAAALCVVALVGCGDDDSASPTATPTRTLTETATRTPTSTPTQPPGPIVFNGEANRLNAYDPADGFRKQTVIPSHADDPLNGRDMNGQICFTRDGTHRFIAGEDTGQPNPPQGWGFFQLRGDRVGTLSATQIGKLTPTYQGSLDNAENYGCGFLSDGRLLTTDVGNQASGAPTGQLIIWFPPFDQPNPRYCKLDTAIGTAGGVWVDAQNRVYVASARVNPGIYRYTGPFPTSDTAAGGCGRRDNTGAPLVDHINMAPFIDADGHVVTPGAIVQTKQGTFYVASVLNGVIAEYDADGRFVRRILQHATADRVSPFMTGTPFGLGIDAAGSVYYADVGLVGVLPNVGPGRDRGTVRRIRFENGQPQPPETMDTMLNFPDGIGILE
jgi:hypothetical protein